MTKESTVRVACLLYVQIHTVCQSQAAASTHSVLFSLSNRGSKEQGDKDMKFYIGPALPRDPIVGPQSGNQ